MLIGLEASALYGCKSGVGYYTENLLQGMMRVAPEHDYLLFSNRSLRDMPRIGTERLYERRYFRTRAAWMQGVLPSALREVRPEVCHFTNYLAPLASGCPSVVTIYDMTLFIMPQYHRFKKLVLDRTLIPHVARRAGAIITISNSARDDIVRLLHVPREKVRVIPAAASPAFRPISAGPALEAIRSRYGLQHPFVLYVGTIEPRKNLPRLVKAFSQLKKRGLPHKLAIVGQAGWHCRPIYEEVERLGLTSEVIFTGYVPFEELAYLYSAADAVAFPSLYEGFGLPVVEAMACGTPVVTSDNSSLKEVGGDAAVLVNPLSVGEIADGLYRVLTDRDFHRHLSLSGLERSNCFTWEGSAHLTLQLYEQVAHEARSGVRSGLRAPSPDI